MNKKLILAGLLGFASLLAPMAYANTVAGTPEASVTAGRVSAALSGLNYINSARPNADAPYYFYLCSASWCGPCNREMPAIAKAYEEMKASGKAELILIGHDQTPEKAAAFLEKYGAAFPGVMKADAASLPGLKPVPGVPWVHIVDANGNAVDSGHGSKTLGWQKIIADYEAKQGGSGTSPAPAAKDGAEGGNAGLKDKSDGGEGEAVDAEDEKKKAARARRLKKARTEVAKALAELDYLTDDEPNLKAKYYIYLASASYCGPCNAEMPHVVEAYDAMKKDKVELILVSADNSPEVAKAFLRKFDASFPLIMGKQAKDLPGFTVPNAIPNAIIVDSSGQVLANGHGAAALKWYEYTGGKKPKAKKNAKKDKEGKKARSRRSED